eukprot:TRINITY_DN3308_c0_g1_i1.p1 TRINITY_DN3308_c0_g1~~TRINITY_DN3308_c0_g1_i1.p1  ORF type:complete len:560 (+),score=183.31 TRINITY_DN3308_c0_g1_i1:54-1733(+)
MNSAPRLSKDDYKKQKELEEARKNGTVAPETDEDGNAINPHIPTYIANAPWYLNSGGPSLKHQRTQGNRPHVDTNWYERGRKAGPAATKFRKGACTNCGAMTHAVKDCVERPRKVGAKFTSEDIKEDEIVQQFSLDYDGKRDRWNGYNPDTYKTVIRTYEKADSERKKQKSDDVHTKFMTEADEAHSAKNPKKKDPTLAEESDSSGSEREDAEFLEGTGYNNAPIQKMDPKTRTTIRNLRIREDTAKYLRNLDLNSAYYDPKTRSMRENPNKGGNASEQLYAGDNFIRLNGDVKKYSEMQLYAWEAYEKGQEVHLQGAPSQAELLYKDFKHKKESLKYKTKETIINKYGGQEHLDAPPKELLLAQTESYVEYAPSGKVIKGQEKALPKSKYDEDVYLSNHTQVWGSFWENGEWGFACCHQLVKGSYCTGEAGKAVKQEMQKALAPSSSSSTDEPEEDKTALDPSLAKKLKKKKEKELKEKEEKEKKEKEERFNRALQAEDALRNTSDSQYHGVNSDRKRAYNSRSKDDYNVTEEDMEAYRLKRLRSDDPMKDFVGKDLS